MKSLRVYAGSGTRVFSVGNRLSISARTRVALGHAWKAAMGGDELRVAVGLVNGLEPFMEGRTMDGLKADGTEDPLGVPRLKLSAERFDATGRSYIVVRVRVSLLGRMVAENLTPEDLRIEQTATRVLPGGRVGQVVLAVLRRGVNEEGFGRLHQVARHDFQHGTSVGPGGFRHWFLPT